MCGIFAYLGKNTAAGEIVIDGLRMLEYRGYDSWGVAVKKLQEDSAKSLLIKKGIGKIGQTEITKLPESRFAFGHTRWATHGGISKANTHPHLDCTGKILIIHNGIIENFQELKKKLIRLGHRFVSQTDSEVAAHLIEEYRKKHGFSESVRRSFAELVGLNAIIAMDTVAEKFIVVRNGSPVVIGFGKKENLIASDAQALLPHTREVYFLKDQELAEVTASAVLVKDSKSGKRKFVKTVKLHGSVQAADKGSYRHFMAKEIYEQPMLIKRIAQNHDPNYALLTGLLKKKTAVLVGCGSASYAALAGSYLFSKIAGHPVGWILGSEFAYQAHKISSASLVIALSQSGETADILEAVKIAKAKKAVVAALVNTEGSSLCRLADYSLMLNAGVEKAVASTKAFTAKLACLLRLAYQLKEQGGLGRQALMVAAGSVSSLFLPESLDKITRLANRLRDQNHLYVVGRGLAYPASLETALKIKEITYLHAEGFAAGELKHGVIALIEKGTPCLVFLPNDEAYPANLAGAMEMKARGARIIGVSYQDNEIFTDFVKIPDAGEATIIPNVVFGQLLAYRLALAKNLDPDLPRNLAKSVTVK